MDDLKNILESLLFVSDEPLSARQLNKILPETDTREIRRAMSELAADYDDRQTSFHLGEVAGGYQLRTRPAYTEWIRRLVQPKPARLSKAALETLAIVAYKQPVLRADIEHIRGVDSGGTLRLLMERNLIRILGRKEIPGRPLIYATTKLFLEIFGLKDLKELPTPAEIESLDAFEGQKNPLPETDTTHPAEPGQKAASENMEKTGETGEIPFEDQAEDQAEDQIENQEAGGQVEDQAVAQTESQTGNQTDDFPTADPSDLESEVKPAEPIEKPDKKPDEPTPPADEKGLDADSGDDYKRDDSSETGG
ncbi:MAG: SMC-Scp complex subunit ScpB [Deltaproteobacteria bacterium]|nr:MAG: SMC-Scp complex subunit ScpB [Deltaproteobacteria bacterium]